MGMKSLLILILTLALAVALFFSRPTSADFQKFIRENTKIVNNTPTGGPTLTQQIESQLKNALASTANETAADVFLKQCEYDNYILWTNVRKDGKVIYTGIVGHWFQRGGA